MPRPKRTKAHATADLLHRAQVLQKQFADMRVVIKRLPLEQTVMKAIVNMCIISEEQVMAAVRRGDCEWIDEVIAKSEERIKAEEKGGYR